MRTYLIPVLISYTIFSFAQGITFYNGTWEEAVVEAKNKEKYILVDACTEWCYWCKVMDKETFPNEEVGKFYNESFIAYKMDMEKDIGIKIAAKYRVFSYPSFLFFNSGGSLVYKEAGFKKPEDFIISGKHAMTSEKQLNYDNNISDLKDNLPEFYIQVFRPRKERDKVEEKTIIKFLNKQKDLFSVESWSIMYRFPLNDHYNQFVLENKDRYGEMYGAYEIERKLISIIYSRLEKAIEEKDESMLEDVWALVDQVYEENVEVTKLSFKISFYQKVEDWNKYAETIEAYISLDQYKNTSSINNYAWTIYEKVDDKAVVEKATSWMKEVIAQDQKYIYVDTYAALLYKGGDLVQAEKYALEAIAVGKESEQDTKGTEELLAKIRGTEAAVPSE